MSAVAFIAKGDICWLITDGAAIDKDGTVAAFVHKQLILPNIGAAMTVRGMLRHRSIIQDQITSTSTCLGPRGFDETIENISDQCRKASRRVNIFKRGLFDVFICGISQLDGAKGYLITNHSGHGGVEKFKPLDLCKGLSIPVEDEGLDEAFEDIGRNVNVETVAARMLQKMRQVNSPSIDGRTSCQVGGFGQLTEIRRYGVFTKVICKWPDEIGKPIDPKKEFLLI